MAVTAIDQLKSFVDKEMMLGFEGVMVLNIHRVTEVSPVEKSAGFISFLQLFYLKPVNAGNGAGIRRK